MKSLRTIVSLALALLVGSALAAGPAAVRKQVESTLLVTGTVDIEPDGSVSGYTLDRSGELPPVVNELLDRATSGWKFEPILVAGKPVPARTAMSIRLVAKRAADGEGIDVRIAAGHFGKPDASRPLQPPVYPMDAARAGVGGTVYVVVRVGRNGNVEDAIAEQVNLKVIDSEAGMDRWRRMFAQAAVRGASAWTFDPATSGDEIDAPFWLVRVPVDFVFRGDRGPKYGTWESYVPGPRQSAPWMDSVDASLGADAVAAGSIQFLGTGRKLLTPISG
ncbi:MAG TPA: energy transducer TonB [Lysobacter sp.]